jgi:hypothetical protein
MFVGGAITYPEQSTLAEIEAVSIFNSGKLFVNGTIDVPILMGDNSDITINGGKFKSIIGRDELNTININILDDKIFELNTSNSNKKNIINNVEDFNIQGNSQVVINEIDSSITGNLIVSPQASVAVSKNASLIGNGEIINHGIINVANTANIGKTSDTLNIANVNSKGMITNSGLINLNPNANIYTTKIINNKVGDINLQGSVIAMPIDTNGNIVEDNNFISNEGNIDIAADGSISALTLLGATQKNSLNILNSGNITSIGNINMPISFGETGGTITINGGKINQITGIVDGEEQVNFNILNNIEFILDNTNILNNIKTINIQGNSNIVLSNTAENIQELFIAPTAMLGIQTGATFRVNKVYNNGTVSIEGNGNLGESDNLLLNDINNKGIINSSGNVYAKNIINHKDAKIILNSNYL